MSHRPIYQIEEDRSHMRFVIQRLIEDHSNLTEELEMAEAWRDFITGEDQRCHGCGGRLEKPRTQGNPEEWICLKCLRDIRLERYQKKKS